MFKIVAATILAASAAAPALATDFGIRTVSGVVTVGVAPKAGPLASIPGREGEPILKVPSTPYQELPIVTAGGGGGGGRLDMGGVRSIGSRWGTVTSMFRSAEHNRAVGGQPNSYHLRGRAIDIARRPGVSHWQIAAALRSAGYNLLESLDEGDHSHFAFGGPGEIKRHFATGRLGRTPRAQIVLAKAGGETQWRIVYAPGGAN